MHKISAIFLASIFAIPAFAADFISAPVGPGTQGLNIPPNPPKLNITQRTVDLLGDALSKQTGAFRARIARDLGMCESPALKYLIPALSDADPLVRAEAARGIANINDQSAASAINPLINDPIPAVRREAVLAAARLGATELVTNALGDSDPSVLVTALQSATTKSQADRIAADFPKYTHSQQPFAAEALGRIGHDAVSHVDILLPLLKLKSDPLNRTAAIRAIGLMKASAQLPEVTTALSDPNPTVRRAALAALGQIVPENLDLQHSSAIHALEDPDPTVRESASNLLSAYPTPSAIELLTAQLPAEYAPLHDAARLALVAIGAPSIPTGAKLIEDTNPRRREDGSFILGKLKSNENIKRHIGLLADVDWNVAAQAAKSMFLIAPPAADVGPQLVALLTRAEKIEDTESASAAILAAGRVHYLPIADRVQRLLPKPPPRVSWPTYPVRLAAAWSIGMTAEPQSKPMTELRNYITNHSGDPMMVFEAVKAMVNSNQKDIAPALKDWNTDQELNSGIESRWMAHEAYDLFMGAHTNYIPPQRPPFEPDLSIVDQVGK